MTTLQLTGTGAAYIRVSTDQQDTERQYAAIRVFAARHKANITDQHWHKDEGWARDADKKRPAFNRLLGAAERGEVQWIVVDSLDRFGTRNAMRLMGYLADLQDAGCKLYDAAGKDWTADDDGTEIQAWVGGRTSMREQREKSKRVVGGKVALARAGEWMGGVPRLGLDVACYSRQSGEELWRVIWEGRARAGEEGHGGKYNILRRKVYPSGREERCDGANAMPPNCAETEVMRYAPSLDAAKVAAVASVFQRYATETISFTELAHHLNGLGFGHALGGKLHGHHVRNMLADPAYIGYPAYNKNHAGKFHRYTDGQTAPVQNYEQKITPNPKGDWVLSRERLYEPLVERPAWEAVQRKLDGHVNRPKAPKSPATYLSGLLHCANCGGRMVVGPKRRGLKTPRPGHPAGVRHEYICGTYQKHAVYKTLDRCACLRNGVFQDALEGYVARYLAEAGKRLELLKGGQAAATGRLEQQETHAWEGFRDGIARLTGYLAEHHPDEYNAIRREAMERREEEEAEAATVGGPYPPGSVARHLGEEGRAAFEQAKREASGPLAPDDFVDALVDCYRRHFDPSGVKAEAERVEAQHTALMKAWADLPTPRAKEKAKGELVALEARIAELEAQQQDAGEVVMTYHRQMNGLQLAIADAKLAMRSEGGEAALRRKAEALRAVVHRIDCAFTATGHTGGGPGKSNSRLVQVTIHPIAGDAATFSPAEADVLNPKKVCVLW